MIGCQSNDGESPSGKAPDFDSGIRRFDPYLPSQNAVSAQARERSEQAKPNFRAFALLFMIL